MLEDAAHRQFHAELVPDAAREPGGQREWPPRSKKPSSMPTASTPSTSANRSQSSASWTVRGPGPHWWR
ncbi:hypothetical protein ACR6C2_37595 [Streptomyces sp. INA 01156]